MRVNECVADLRRPSGLAVEGESESDDGIQLLIHAVFPGISTLSGHVVEFSLAMTPKSSTCQRWG